MWTLASAFPNKEMAKSYFSRHWDTWVTEEDIASIAKAGLTHVKIPVGHWIMGDIRGDEPWIDGDWPYLLRCLLCKLKLNQTLNYDQSLTFTHICINLYILTEPSIWCRV